MRVYSWIFSDPKWRHWTEASGKKFNKAIEDGDKRLAMRVAALWQARIMTDPRYGNIDDTTVRQLEKKITTGA